MSMVLGQFSLNPKFNRVAFACGGIGITAARSNIKWTIDTNADIHLIIEYY